jgi:hypothetical protein
MGAGMHNNLSHFILKTIDSRSKHMKRLTALVLVLASLHLAAQSEDSIPAKGSYRFGFNASATYMTEMGELLLSPSVTFQTPKHLLSLGPLFMREKDPGARNGGVEFNYQYYPNTSKHRFNLYLLADASYFRYHNSHVFQTSVFSYNNNPPTIDMDQVHVNWSTSYLKFGAGYGMRLKLTRWWYLYQHNSIGAIFSGSSSTSKYEKYPIYNRSYSSRLLGEDPEFCFQFTLGMGFLLY